MDLWKKVALGIGIAGAVTAVYLYLRGRKAYAKPLTTAELMEEFHKLGDVNRDGIIDDKDVALLSAAYGSKPGMPNWDPNCDLNGDDKVDGKDIAIAAKHRGLTFEQWLKTKGLTSSTVAFA